MFKANDLKLNIIQILSISEKELKLHLRYGFNFALQFIKPLISIFIPYIILTKIFSLSEAFYFDYYTAYNFLLFLLIAFSINYMFGILKLYKDTFRREKIWQTLKGLIIAPFNRFNLIVGILLTELIIIIPTVAIFIIICYLLFPIPLINLLYFCLIFLAIIIIFMGIGVLIGVIDIVNEDISNLLLYATQFISWLSCVTYPLKIFPKILQFFIKLNPFYYIFDLLRLSWWAGIDPVEASRYITWQHYFILISMTIGIPIIGLYSFDRIYNRYGISGY
jgi:ABC-type polysaccharide/polyol phosphate export permease